MRSDTSGRDVVRVLVVEDDQQIGDALACGLQQAGFAVDWVHTAAAAEAAVRTHGYGVAILDLGLPDCDGLDLLARVRTLDARVAVLILTARDGRGDRVAGLDAGADDYVVKPFDLDEICARVRALGRRFTGERQTVVRHRDIDLDPASRKVSRGGAAVDLSRREFDILAHLLERRGRVVSRASLEQQLYAWGEEVASNTVEVHVHHLRRKLGYEVIRTVRGVGYTIESPP